jgi:hypothetical protein
MNVGDSENRTSASGRMLNDPGPESSDGGGVVDMLEENLEQQRPGANISDSEAEYNKPSQ